MPVSPKLVLERLERISHAWSNLRPGKTFAGLTHEQFLAAIKPIYEVRAEIAESEVRMQSSQTRRVKIDEDALRIGQRIVNAVRADPEEGDDGEMYVAMGYMRSRDRRRISQRKRPGAAAEAPLAGVQKEGAAQ